VAQAPDVDPMLPARLAAIVESSDDAIVSKTLDGIITSWNGGAERMFGYSAPEALGQSILLIIPADRRSEEDTVLAQIRAGGKVAHFETVRVTKEGQLVPVSVTISPIRDPSGAVIGASKIARDISDRARADEDRARLAAIVDSSDDAIVSKDLNGIVRTWNHGAERLFGYTAEEAVGRSILLIIPSERRSEEEFVLGRLRCGQKIDHFETIRLRKNGEEVPVSLTVSPIRDGRGRIIGASKIARDIRAQKELERERAERLAAAEQSSREKDEFLALLGHELRTPLAAIYAAAQLLDAQAELPAARSVVQRQALYLRRLVDDLFDVSRVRAGKLLLERQALELGEAVERALAVLRSGPQPPTQQIETQLAKVVISADPVRLQQILINVLSNAVKYTPADGRIRILLAAEEECAVLRVEDNGAGITADLLPRIFDLFVQGDPQSPRLRSGLGIGLSLVRTLTELHGGSVSAHSQGPGAGSSFTLRFPRAAVAPEAAARAVPDTIHESGRRILLVEDNGDAREMLAMLLRLHGHEVHEAADGAQAVEQAEAIQPEVMLVDLHLPVLDGHEVARRVRRLALPGLRLVAVSGFGRPEDHHACREAGFDALLLKPVSMQQISEVLREGSGPVRSR
jgi:PAS domain S-box-containing protein